VILGVCTSLRNLDYYVEQDWILYPKNNWKAPSI
jgi:hypothetical protein